MILPPMARSTGCRDHGEATPFGRHDREEGIGFVLELHTQLLTGSGGPQSLRCRSWDHSFARPADHLVDALLAFGRATLLGPSPTEIRNPC